MPNRRRLFTLFSTLTVVLATLSPMPAYVNPEMCQMYGTSATQAQAVNKNMHCNIGLSPRFDPDGSHHETWCKGARLETVQRETADRLNELNGCSKDAMCEAYAESAELFGRRNIDLQCGFKGARWNPDRVANKNWCAGTDKENAYNEAKERLADMDRCTTCDVYAKEALRLVDQRKRSTKCAAPTGVRWSTDRQVHFGWCMGARLSSLHPENQARADEVVNCNK